MSEPADYEFEQIKKYVDALSKNVIAYAQRHPFQSAVDKINQYCDGHHSALDGCECSLIIRFIKGERRGLNPTYTAFDEDKGEQK